MNVVIDQAVLTVFAAIVAIFAAAILVGLWLLMRPARHAERRERSGVRVIRAMRPPWGAL